MDKRSGQLTGESSAPRKEIAQVIDELNSQSQTQNEADAESSAKPVTEPDATTAEVGAAKAPASAERALQAEPSAKRPTQATLAAAGIPTSKPAPPSSKKGRAKKPAVVEVETGDAEDKAFDPAADFCCRSVRLRDRLGPKTIYVQGGSTVVVLGFFGALLYYLICVKPKCGDFLIATEGEMKKVNWSTRREIIGSTWVVIGLTFFIAVAIFILDYLIFTPFFQWINVLDS